MTQPLAMPTRRRFATMGAGAALALAAGAARAASASEIARDARASRDTLYATNAKAKALGAQAKGVLIFPNIRKAGAMVGGQTGNGALFVKGQARSFYNISAASFGFQLGVQKFAYAMFLMTDKAVADLNAQNGWAVGSSPSLVLVDEGYSRTMNTKTLSKDVYVMAYGQKGLMAGTGLEGSKITQITPDP